MRQIEHQLRVVVHVAGAEHGEIVAVRFEIVLEDCFVLPLRGEQLL